MEATVAITDGATIEFGVTQEPGGYPERMRDKHFCILRADRMKVMILLEEPPGIVGNGPAFDNETARVVKLLHWVYGANNPMYVSVPGWGPGRNPDEAPIDDWQGEAYYEVCQPYTELLQTTSLEELAGRLLDDSRQLRLDYLERHFAVLLAGSQVFPDRQTLSELLQEYLQCENPSRANWNPFFTYAQDQIRRKVAREDYRTLAELGLSANMNNGYFSV